MTVPAPKLLGSGVCVRDRTITLSTHTNTNVSETESGGKLSHRYVAAFIFIFWEGRVEAGSYSVDHVCP